MNVIQPIGVFHSFLFWCGDIYFHGKIVNGFEAMKKNVVRRFQHVVRRVNVPLTWPAARLKKYAGILLDRN